MKRLCLLLLCTVMILSGCATAQTSDSDNNSSSEATEKEKVVYTSQIQKDECALCSKGGKTLLSAYAGQNNIGIICINTFDMSPVSINRYDDYGNLIEKEAGYMSNTHNSFGEGGMSTSITPNSDRGYANVDVRFTGDKTIDKTSVEKLLCQDCLTAITKDSWGEPYGVGVINFETLEVKLFEENVTAFSFGDYYIDIDRRENTENPEQIELDLLILYCPSRYEN